MDYDFSLKTVGVLVGILYIALHALALAKPEETRQFLKEFPRSHAAGVILLSIDLAWAFWLAYHMDWGEFYYLEKWMLIGLPIAFYLTLHFVDEYLAVRALGILLLLAAAPVLDAAFLKPPVSRLLVVALAYAWVVAGMIWVGQPHQLRDQIGWLNRSAGRLKLAAGAGAAYGMLILICALVAY